MALIIKETAKGLQTIPIEDAFLMRRVVFLTSGVDAATSSELIKQLLHLEADAPGKPITFYINSPGGEVMSGLAVYDCIRLLSSPVRTVCIGTAASMGSLLFLAGEERLMLPHSQLMIHDPSYSHADYSHKKPDEIEEEIAELKKTRDILCGIIAERTGQPLDRIYEKTKLDSWFPPAEAIAFGLATGIISSADVITHPEV